MNKRIGFTSRRCFQAYPGAHAVRTQGVFCRDLIDIMPGSGLASWHPPLMHLADNLSCRETQEDAFLS